MDQVISLDWQPIAVTGGVANVNVGIPPIVGSLSSIIASITWFGSAITASNYPVYFDTSELVIGWWGTSYDWVQGYGTNYINSLLRITNKGLLNGWYALGIGFNGSVAQISKSSWYSIVCGDFTTFNWVSAVRIVKILDSWLLDTSFTSGTGFDSIVNKVVISWSYIYCSWTFTQYNWVACWSIVRLNLDGTLDVTFSTVITWINDFKIESGWKVIICGSFTNRIARLNTDWSIDATFIVWSGLNADAYALCIQSDGKIIVSWFFTSYNWVACSNIIRLDTVGTKDATFLSTTWFDWQVTKILQNGTDIWVSWFFSTYDWVATTGLCKLSSIWSIDVTLAGVFSSRFVYNPGIIGIYDFWFDVTDVYMCGNINTYNSIAVGNLLKIDSSGNQVSFFWELWFYSQVFQSYTSIPQYIVFDGTNYYVWWRDLYPYISIRTYNGNFLNNNFCIWLDGKVVENKLWWYGGWFRLIEKCDDNGYIVQQLSAQGQYNTTIFTSNTNMFKINSDATYNSVFPSNTNANIVRFIKVAGWVNKMIVLATWSMTFSWTTRARIAKIDTITGAVDTSFSYTTWFNQAVNDWCMDASGNIYCVGNFTSYNGGTGNNRIIKLLANGTKDTSFVNTTGFSGAVNRVFNCAVGWVYVSSNIARTYKASNSGLFWKILANGSIDSTFMTNIGSWPNSIVSSIIENNWKLYVFGAFTTWNGTTCNNAIRLNLDGTIDNIFGTGFSSWVTTAYIYNTQLFVFGSFTTYQGTSRKYWCSINI